MEAEPLYDRHDQAWFLPWENPMRARFSDAFFRGIPNGPGVYIMLDEAGQVLYIGKSCQLRTRLLSYRSATPKQDSRKVLRLVSAVQDIRWEPCKRDEDACLRENFLLRNYRPPYNVMNTKPFIYEYINWRVQDGLYHWQLTVNAEILEDTMVFGAFKGRRMTKRAYQALMRLLWVRVREATRLSELPHPLVLEKAPRNCSFGVSPDHHAELHEQLVGFLRGEHPGLLETLVHDLETRAAAIEPFLRDWLHAEIEILADFFERTLRGHREMRGMLLGDASIIPQEKVDDLLLMHKNARPESD